MTLRPKYRLCAIVLIAWAAAAKAQEVPLDIATLKAAVLSATNVYRASKKLPELQPDASLDAAASAYADPMRASSKQGAYILV